MKILRLVADNVKKIKAVEITPNTSGVSFRDAALSYRDAGLHAIPIAPRGKTPLVEWKRYQDAMPSVAEIEAWSAAWPDANTALVMGRGLLAVDIDGLEGAAALVERGFGDLGMYPASQTARGSHLFMRAETAGLSDRLGLFPKVDVRVTGYVVVPPSVHESGHVYSWVRPIDDAVVPPAPPALLALLSKPRYHEVTGERAPWLVDALAGAGEGDRHGTCGRLAGYFLSKGIPEDVVRSLLLSWGARCSPPFDADEIEKYVADIAAKEPRTEPPSSIAESVDAVLARVLAPPASRKVAATGLASFDDLLGGGFETGTIFLGARPGVGKTALAMQIARRLALSGTGVFISTLEMSKEQLIRRMLVQESCVRATAVKTGQLVDIERAMLTKAAAKLRPLPIWFGEDLYTVAQLDAALSVYEPGAVGFAVVDYLQLMSAENDRLDNRQRVEAVGRGLKKLTRKYDLPLLVLSSLVRPTNDHNWRPSLKSLRESGELEHLGDVVFFLHRAETEKVQTELIHAKAREGEIGDLRLRFSGELQTFTEVV